jgi:pimeloyl-ACP methyl ester carboxylesterase
MELTQRTVVTPALEFGVLEAGSGPLALCLHGFPDSAYTWRYLLPALADAGYHAVAPFMRGYAPTQVPADGLYQGGALAADAVALHDALGGDGDAALIGHDWGAMAAYGAAAYAPERWKRVVALAVPPPVTMLSSFFAFEQLKRSFYIFLFQTPLAEGAVAVDDLSFIDGLWHDWSPGYDGTEDLAHVKDALRDPANLSAAIGYYRAMLQADLHGPEYADAQEATQRVNPQPTLYLHGTTDGALGVECVSNAHSALSEGSRVEVIDGVGHFLHLERPEDINQRILGWIQG